MMSYPANRFVIGQEVALWVKDNFKKTLVGLQSYKSKCYKEALEECFLKLDELMATPAGQRKLQEYQSTSDGDYGGKSFAGCTATVILVTRTEIICANAGDSRTVLSSGGRAKDMSEDHKPENPGELSRIQRSGGFVEDGRVNGMLALSRALGDFEYKNNSSIDVKLQAVTAFPDVSIEPINAQTQYVLLACDGIWDVKTSQEAIDFMNTKLYKGNFASGRREMRELEASMTQLLDECCARDIASSQGLGCDNMTAIIVEINQNK